MLKYKDQYRVDHEKDTSGKECEGTSVRCTRCRGTEIYRWGDNKLAVYIPSTQVGRKILSEHPALFTLETETSSEMVFLFDEANLDEAAVILKARKKVKMILTDEQRAELRDRMLKARESLIK